MAGHRGVDVGGIVAVHRCAHIQDTAAIGGVGAGDAGVVGGLNEDGGGLLGREVGVLREYGGDGAGHDRGAGGRAVDHDALAVEPGGLDAVTGGGELKLFAGIGERHLLLQPVDRTDGEDTRVGGGPGELGGLVVAGGGDDERAVAGGVVDRGVERGAGGVAAEADVDDAGTGVDGGNDRLGNSKEIAGARRIRNADTQEVRGGGDAGGVGREAGGEGGDRGTVAVVTAVSGRRAVADVERTQPARAEGGVRRDAGVENRDGGAAAPGAAVAGGAEGGERVVAEGDLVDGGAVFAGRRVRQADERIGGDAGVVAGVSRQLALQRVEGVETHAHRA